MIEEGVRKRNKPTLVCTNCKKRKIKCDRKMPCSSCVKMNAGFSCSYETKWRPVSFEAKQRSSNNSLDSQLDDSSSNEVSNPLKEELTSLKRKLHDLETTLNKQESETPDANSITSRSVTTTSSSPRTGSNSTNPHVSDGETINFFEGYTPLQIRGNIRRVNYGPLSWPSLMRKDPWLNVLWKHLDAKSVTGCLITQRLPQFSQENMSLFTASMLQDDETKQEVSNSEKMFRKRALENDGYDEVVPYKSLAKYSSTHNTDTQRGTVNVSTMTLGKTLFDGRLNPELQLIERIKLILPRKRVIWSLIDRFFQILYPHFPFIDELDFKKELSRIVGPISYEDEPLDKVKIEKKLDLAHLSICLIILRLSYLSLFSNRNCVNEETMNGPEDTIEKYLFKNPINLVCIEVANSCIQCFQYGRKSNLIVFQALLFMRLYRNHAPEEGDGIDGGDSQVSTAMLVQMAFSLGLNREPDKFDNCFDEKTNHMGRKIWHFLLRSDLIHCYSVGNPTTINMKHFDVKVPFVTERNSNLVDVELESAVVHSFSFLRDRLGPLRGVLDMILDINKGTPINVLTALLNDVERVATDTFNVLGGASSTEPNPRIRQYLDVVKSKIFISVKTSLTTLYYHLYLYYEKSYNNELSFFYMKKIYTIIHEDLVPYLPECLYGRFAAEGIVLNPTMQMAMHKSNQFNLSCLTRVNYLKYSMESKADHTTKMQTDLTYRLHYNRFVSLAKNLRRTGDLFTMVFERFGTRYYYAWRVSKAHRTLFAYLSNPDLYTKPVSGIKKLHAFQFTAEQLEEIDTYIHSLGKKVEQAMFYEDRIDKDVNTTKKGSTWSPAVSTKSDSNVTPYSSIGSPPSGDRPSNQYIDQMWLSMMAMKYEPLDSSGNVMATNESYYQDNGVPVEGVPVITNTDTNGNSVTNGASTSNINSNGLHNNTANIQGSLKTRQSSFVGGDTFSYFPYSPFDPTRTPFYPNNDSITAQQPYLNSDFDLISAYNLDSLF
ncbi:uncharacterized protein RJT20DRAFT_90428 [Scheffersomyces xylosifermentans]|uniref:uncharacterized protein n=1 Tax=Scheffersomyces xylosifermentans TaxID=1304137 RepID=UPI00315D1F17